MTLAAVTDISRHPEIFTLPSADELSQSSTREWIQISGSIHEGYPRADWSSLHNSYKHLCYDKQNEFVNITARCSLVSIDISL
jgi:hypothetical protein